jgi:hypothetical protein
MMRPLLLFLLLIVVASSTHALSVRGKNVTLVSPVNTTIGRRLLRKSPNYIVLVKRVLTEPLPEDTVLATLAKGLFLIKASDYIAIPGDEVSSWLPEYKTREGRTDFPLLVTCLVPCLEVFRPSNRTRPLLPKRWIVLEGNLTRILNHPYVLSAETATRVSMISFDSLQTHYPPPRSTSTSGYGAGIIISIPDTGIDPYHCAFYDSSNPSPRQGNILPSTHSKIASLITAIPGVTDYRGANGAHGTATAGQAAGFECLGETGLAAGAKIAFYDITPAGGDEEIDLPYSFYQYLLDVCDTGGASVVSISWGGSDLLGIYDDMASILDDIARQRPYCSFTAACGNSGPNGKCASPATAKNFDSVGASFTRPQAYPFWDDATTHPERYQSTVIASFSSTGPLKGGRRAPLFFSGGVFEYLPFAYFVATANHKHYNVISGTSFSAPGLAGLKAEIQRRFKLAHGGSQLPTAALVTAILIGVSEPMTAIMQVSSNLGATPLLGATINTEQFGFPYLPASGLNGTAIEDFVSNTFTRRGYCFQTRIAQTQIKAGLAWHDISVDGGFDGPILVNDLDARIFVDNLPIYPVNDDALNPNDEIKYDIADSTITHSVRLVVYESYAIVQEVTQPFGLHVVNVSSVTSCGTCFGFEVESCGVNSYRYCNTTTGEFDGPCLVTTSTNQTSCSTTTGTLVNGTQCQCRTGYVFIHGICACVPGVERSCGVDQVNLCGVDGLYGTLCYSTYFGAAQASQIVVQVASAHQAKLEWIFGLFAVFFILTQNII